jgi:hypothetical protein
MRPVIVVTLDKVIEPALLQQKIVAGWFSCLLLEGQVHLLMAAILLGMAGFDAFDPDTEPQPPDRESAQAEQGMTARRRMNRAGGGRSDHWIYLDQLLTDHGCSPGHVLPLDPQDSRFNLERQLVGMSVRASGTILQPVLPENSYHTLSCRQPFIMMM